MADKKPLDPRQLAERLERELADELEAIRDPEIRAEAERRLREVTGRLRSTPEGEAVIEKGPLDFIRDAVGRSRARARSRRHRRERVGVHVDNFGFDRVYWQRVEPLFRYLHDSYFRVETQGIEHVPIQGRALLVANHAGVLPWDAMMIREAVQREHPAQRHVRPLVEDFTYQMPFLGPFLRKVGVARGDPQNAERLLEDEKLVLVFPEGIQGITKPYAERYRVQRFGRGGTIKLAARTGSPIIPVAIVGSEEIYPVLGRSEWLGRLMGLPTLPITPIFPWLGPAGLLPLPSKWYIRFGAPIELPEAAEKLLDDEIRVSQFNEQVRQTVQHLIFDVLRERRSAWFG